MNMLQNLINLKKYAFFKKEHGTHVVGYKLDGTKESFPASITLSTLNKEFNKNGASVIFSSRCYLIVICNIKKITKGGYVSTCGYFDYDLKGILHKIHVSEQALKFILKNFKGYEYD